MAYDAYGLHHAADKPQREGHAISMMGRDDARAAIEELHKKFTNRNKLLAFAVNPDQRVRGEEGLVSVIHALCCQRGR
jgi:hypothetical protein